MSMYKHSTCIVMHATKWYMYIHNCVKHLHANNHLKPIHNVTIIIIIVCVLSVSNTFTSLVSGLRVHVDDVHINVCHGYASRLTVVSFTAK